MSGVSRELLDMPFPHDQRTREACHSVCIGGQASWPLTPESNQRSIACVLGVPAERAAAIAAEYPLGAYPSPTAAFSAVVSDQGFATGALQLSRWASEYAPVYAYQ